MEYTPEIASALDIYADEMTTSSRLQPLLTIDCPNEEISSLLYSLYHDIMNVEFNLFGWCRSMCKYGDFFLYLDIDEKIGVSSVIGLPTSELERLEGEDRTNPNYVQYQWNSGGMTFENWQVAHFRILGNDKYAPYGSSALEPARRIWRQLTLLEDAMMAYRIVRSPERRVFYVDVGNVPTQDVEQYMQKVMTQMKRHQVVDANTGRVDLRYNPMSVDEDYFIPVRGGTNSRVETLPGGTYTGDIEDVKYLRDKLFSALKVPQSYMSRGEGADEDKTTLAQKDIRFARTIQRLQRSVITELEKIGLIHLYVLGFRSEDLLSFKLSLNNPSKIAELQELEHWGAKFDTASKATEGFFSHRWLARKLFGMSEEEFLRNQREMFYDRKFESSLEVAGEAEQAAAYSASGTLEGGDAADVELGDDLESPEGLPDFDPEDLDEPEADSPLIVSPDTPSPAPPGKRDDVRRYEKSAYKLKHPSKDMRRVAGRRKRMLGSVATEVGKNTKRNTMKGYSELSGLYESKDTNYLKEERQIFEMSKEVKNLINSLNEKMRNKDET